MGGYKQTTPQSVGSQTFNTPKHNPYRIKVMFSPWCCFHFFHCHGLAVR